MPAKHPISKARDVYYRTKILDFCQDGFIEEVSANSITVGLVTKVFKITHGTKYYILKSIACSSGDMDIVTDARNEYEIAKLLSSECENIAAPLDIKDWVDSENSNEICIEMLFEHGGESLLSYFRKIKSNEIMEIIRQTVFALAIMENHGVFHSDVKPDNIVIKDGIVKIIDFGVSQKLKEKTFLMKTITKEMKGGTLIYCPPEVSPGSKVVFGPVDMYCWGMTFYQLITGINMEQMNDESEKYRKQGNDYKIFMKMISELKIDGDVIGHQSKILSDILLRVLDYNPKNRPTFNALLDIFGKPVKMGKGKVQAEDENMNKKLKEFEGLLSNSRMENMLLQLNYRS